MAGFEVTLRGRFWVTPDNVKLLTLIGVLALFPVGDRIDEIKWLSAKEAFEKATNEKSSRWVLIYKEWPS